MNGNEGIPPDGFSHVVGRSPRWSIENGTHYPLDVSAGEDRCRVHQPVAATVLGILRRAVAGEGLAWARRQVRARDRTYPIFLSKMSRRIGSVIRSITRPTRL